MLTNSADKDFSSYAAVKHGLYDSENAVQNTHYRSSTVRTKTFALNRSRDLAGNNQNSAQQLGTLINNQAYTFRNKIGKSDPNDYYTFTVNTRSNFRAVLSGLGRNANLKLLNTNGANLFRNNSKLSEANRSTGYTRILRSGTYYVRINQTTGKANYNLQFKPVSLTGDIENKGLSFLQDYPDLNYTNGVNFYRYTKNGRTNAGIDSDKKTIVVVHGRGDSSEGSQIKNLSESAAKVYESQNYQVLALDWKAPADDSTLVPLTAARSITPVAQWATRTLQDLGLTGNQIIVFGHSLGAYVSAEVGREFGRVRQLVALDPAFPAQQYDLNGNEPNDQKTLDFKAVAKRSLALVVQDSFSLGSDSIAGDNDQAGTAVDSLLVKYNSPSSLGPTKAHKTVIDVFSNALSERYLKLGNNLKLPSHLYNIYNNLGKLEQSNGSHEGRIIASRSGNVEKLIYVSRKTSDKLQQNEAWKM